MATCKECLHAEACDGFMPSDLDRDVFHYCREGRTDEIPDIEERCSEFKDRRNYAEVVRCENCKKEWCYLRQELGPAGFCSAGERRTK